MAELILPRKSERYKTFKSHRTVLEIIDWIVFTITTESPELIIISNYLRVGKFKNYRRVKLLSLSKLL